MSAAEWLEADGLGGFAMGAADGIRTRRYHGLLVHAATPPTGRMMLANGFEAWIESGGRRIPLTSQRYAPDVIHPDGATRQASFTIEPWPTWHFDLGEGRRLTQALFVPRGLPLAVLSWRLESPLAARLVLRPLLSGRDAHAVQRANPAFGFVPERVESLLAWCSYPGVAPLLSLANAEYRHDPQWYYDFLYEEERARGLDHIEDLASPGSYVWDLEHGEAVWIVAADTAPTRALLGGADAPSLATRLRGAERARRAAFASRLQRSAEDYLVARGSGSTLIAGYPWFTDWGRDTFIALRGLCLAGARLEPARDILREWSGTVSAGMLPNRFPERGQAPEFNSVDASLWFVIAVQDWIEAMRAARRRVDAGDLAALQAAVSAILEGYRDGARHGIRQDVDGLLRAGEPGVQLTWMDAKVGEWVVTPRIGKPVEIQALWINALEIGSRFDSRWEPLVQAARASFARRFWNERRESLFDVVDADHVAGRVDPALRPNQIFAVGGLPSSILDGPRARAVVDVMERELWTPLGLRTLARGEAGYVGHYGGSVVERDGAYHQGTVWPWLMGPFVEAWCRVRGDTAEAWREARERFVQPLIDHLGEAGLGHVSEIADGDPPHTPQGCPFQAWSLGELMRIAKTADAMDPAALAS